MSGGWRRLGVGGLLRRCTWGGMRSRTGVHHLIVEIGKEQSREIFDICFMSFHSVQIEV